MRNQGLDLLRFLAVLLVIGRHLQLREPPSLLIAAWRRGGWIGVDIFFVLSGFLISSLLFNEYSKNGCVNIRRFLVRRAFKIYPAFWVFLISTSLIKISFNQVPSLDQVAGEALFLQITWVEYGITLGLLRLKSTFTSFFQYSS